MNYGDILLKAIVGAVGTGFVAWGFVILKKWIAKKAEERKAVNDAILEIKTDVKSMVCNGKKRAGENQAQFQIIDSQGDAIQAILEVVAKGNNNGNVEKAFSSLEAGRKIYKDFIKDNLVSIEE